MASSSYPNRHQYAFLEKLKEHDVHRADWPDTATLKRWMRRKGFRRAFRRVMDTFRRQRDYVTAGVAVRAAHALDRLLATIDQADGVDNLVKYDKQIGQFLRILRLDQQRLRDQYTGKAAQSRTLAYKEWFERRKSPLWAERNEERSRANRAEYLLKQLKDYWRMIEHPYVAYACNPPEVVAQVRMRRAEELERLEKILRETGLIPSAPRPDRRPPPPGTAERDFDTQNPCP